jgi:hypothetical protein
MRITKAMTLLTVLANMMNVHAGVDQNNNVCPFADGGVPKFSKDNWPHQVTHSDLNAMYQQYTAHKAQRHPTNREKYPCQQCDFPRIVANYLNLFPEYEPINIINNLFDPDSQQVPRGTPGKVWMESIVLGLGGDADMTFTNNLIAYGIKNNSTIFLNQLHELGHRHPLPAFLAITYEQVQQVPHAHNP